MTDGRSSASGGVGWRLERRGAGAGGVLDDGQFRLAKLARSGEHMTAE
jgi:hypothetical protein